MIKKSLFDRVNGLDEKFAVAYNDIDMCLRLRTIGMLNVYVPQALFFTTSQNQEDMTIKVNGMKDFCANRKCFVKDGSILLKMVTLTITSCFQRMCHGRWI